jgi:hypothetical protein
MPRIECRHWNKDLETQEYYFDLFGWEELMKQVQTGQTVSFVLYKDQKEISCEALILSIRKSAKRTPGNSFEPHLLKRVDLKFLSPNIDELNL